MNCFGCARQCGARSNDPSGQSVAGKIDEVFTAPQWAQVNKVTVWRFLLLLSTLLVSVSVLDFLEARPLVALIVVLGLFMSLAPFEKYLREKRFGFSSLVPNQFVRIED